MKVLLAKQAELQRMRDAISELRQLHPASMPVRALHACTAHRPAQRPRRLAPFDGLGRDVELHLTGVLPAVGCAGAGAGARARARAGAGASACVE